MPMNFGRVLLQRGAEGKLKNPALFDGWCGSGDSNPDGLAATSS